MGDINKLKKAIDLLRQEKTMYQNEQHSLESDIEEDKNHYYQDLTRLNKKFKDPKINRGKTGEIKIIQNDTSAVLLQRLTKLIVNNKNNKKVKLIDHYQCNMNVIDEASTTIQATGLTDIL
jgi:hypothetical protein